MIHAKEHRVKTTRRMNTMRPSEKKDVDQMIKKVEMINQELTKKHPVTEGELVRMTDPRTGMQMVRKERHQEWPTH